METLFPFDRRGKCEPHEEEHDCHAAFVDTLDALRRIAGEQRRAIPDDKRPTGGAPPSWRPSFEEKLRALGLSRAKARDWLTDESLKAHWQSRKAVSGRDGVGVEPPSGQDDFLWCDLHLLGCPRRGRAGAHRKAEGIVIRRSREADPA